jgi:hypothetical protein
VLSFIDAETGDLLALSEAGQPNKLSPKFTPVLSAFFKPLYTRHNTDSTRPRSC